MVADRRVVVTGKIAGESRVTAEAKLREAGAIVQSAVGKDTDVLVTGANVGLTKLNKARDLGVEIIPWEQAFGESLSRGNAPPPRAPIPAVRQWAPMLCKAGDIPAGGNWLFEIKWDGQRGIATIKDGAVSLQSRTGKTDLTERFPWVVEELAELPNCVLDGELVTLDEGIRYIVFDVLEVEGESKTSMTLQGRRDVLGAIIGNGHYVAISPAFEDGQHLLSYVIEQGMEGLVAKRLSSHYIEGGRGGEWIKVKVRREQEFIVLGYTAGEGARASTFGALVLGYYEDGEVRYAGKVGTGFDDDCLRMLISEMEPIEAIGCPYAGMPRDVLAETTWLFPKLVVQTAFQKWTEDGMLWHPSYLRVRTDKQPSEVGRDA